MENRRRAMDKPMDSELPTGLSTALPGSRFPTSSTATAAKSRSDRICQNKLDIGICQTKLDKKWEVTLANGLVL